SALTLWKDLAVAAPENPEYANDIAGAMVNLALVRLAEQNAVAAQRLLVDAVPFHVAALKKDPRRPAFLRFYRNNRDALLHATVLLGDHVAAAAAADDLVRHAIELKDRVTAAGGLAGCVFLAERDKSLPSEKRTAAAANYADRAVALLRQAVDSGFRDAGALSQNPRFGPIRDRADFQALLKGMSENPKP